MVFFVSRKLYGRYAAIVQFLLVSGVALLLTLIGYDLTYMGFSTSFLAAGFVLLAKYVGDIAPDVSGASRHRF